MSDRTDQLLEELVRLAALQIRREADSQQDVIVAMLGAGFEAPRIAELLGTTAATVRATRQKMNKKADKAEERTA
jgi:DNA-binding NarL/FixJ family response regulator